MSISPSLETAYLEYRPLLFSIAYRMLGSAADAEELIQETFVRAYSACDEIRAPKQYLTTVLTRLCLDNLKSAATRRTEYVGPWLPEPVATSTSIPTDPESISMAFLLILESLSPIERAVFLLRSVFEYEFQEISSITGKSEANVRQIFHRARQSVRERHPRFHAPPEQRKAVAERFQQACATGDVQELLAVLSPEVTLLSDGGGKAVAATQPILGSDRVSRFLMGILNKWQGHKVELVPTELNAEPAFLLYVNGELISATTLEIEGDVIRAIYIMRNPEKLNPDLLSCAASPNLYGLRPDLILTFHISA
jgi:RNA polymerase sigma-70 factor (ECF subfamily)